MMRAMTFCKPLIAACLLLLAGGCASPRPQDDARPERPAIARIEARGVLLVGSTGDYRPLTWRDPETGRWEGFDIEVAERIADKVWAFGLAHPDGFTLDIRTMTEPTEGIAVSYAATQNSHSREQLDNVVEHALRHEGYVGGWYDDRNGLYDFDSTRLFPEDRLEDALRFGRENGQHSVYILSTGTDVPIDGGE